MEVVFLNNIINVLISLFLVSSISCLPQDSRYYKANIRFPDTFYSNEDFGIYDSDVSGEEKRVRSPTGNGWLSENQHTSQKTQISPHSNSRSDDIQPQKVKGSQIPDDGKIYFPGPIGNNKKEKPVNYMPSIPKDGPPCANGKSFCETAEDYPRALLRDALRKDAMVFQTYFGKDVITDGKDLSFRSNFIPTTNESLQNRIDGNSVETPLCQARESVIFPKMAENADGNWLFIANVDNYIQGVRVEECQGKPSTPCNSMASFPLGYTATCEQKYMYRKLVALNSSGKPIPDSFRLPACCTCKVVFNGLAARSASNSKQEPEPLPLTIPASSTTSRTAPQKTRPQRRLNKQEPLNFSLSYRFFNTSFVLFSTKMFVIL